MRLLCRRHSGITLFEVCLSIAIIGIFAMMAVPSINRAQQSFGLTAIAHEVRTELHRARILAIVRNEDCRLHVTSSIEYRVECQTPAWVPIQLYEMRTGYTVRANNRPEFHPLGNVGPMATITVSNAVGEERRIIVSRSGRIRME